MTINTKIADFLDMDLPKEEILATPVVVLPYEKQQMIVDNNELPDLQDVDFKQLEAEKQLEQIINNAMNDTAVLRQKYDSMEPRFLARTIEVGNDTMKIALDAIKLKLNTQNETRKSRLDLVNYKRDNKPKEINNTTNNIIFSGSREDLLKMFKSKPEEKIIENIIDNNEENKAETNEKDV